MEVVMKKLNELFDCNYDIKIQDIKTNSKEVNKGDLFVCIMGFNADRHDYIKDAEERGAAALVVSHDVNSKLPQIKVKNTNDELLNIVTKFYDYPSKKMNMIGVTGTDGKTSTSTIIYQLLNTISKTGYIGTNGVKSPTYEDDSHNTTPTPEHLHRFFYNFYNDGCKNVVMEAGSEGLAQGRCEGLEFDYSVFTNLTHEHLNYHKTMENYLEAKAILFKQTKSNGYCIINIDDEYGKQVAERCNGKVVYYGKSDEADFRFSDVEIYKTHTVFKLNYKGNVFDIEIPLLGMFNVYNMTASLAVLILMGYDINELKPYFKDLYVDGRMTNIDLGQDFKVIVDYAHTPNGYLNLFELTKTLGARKTIIVAGSAGERDATKRPTMGSILVNNADYVIFTLEDPRTEDPSDIIDQMTSTVMESHEKWEKIVDRHEAIKKAVDIAGPNDMVLILGKGNETYETIGRERIYFNDVEEAHKALESRLKETIKQG
jgi:UDP-N-acetylmuramoyl-L-alanyl-D-glutamate--2,6-diaminopimelate ligase